MWKRYFLFWRKKCIWRRFLKDKFHGEGVLFKGNGDIIEGHFENGIKNERGKIYNQNGDLIFEGEIENGK